jgi:short-subunit dehydrogenase
MRTVWITGGGTGIGRALAQRCYDNGDRVVISGRRADVLEQALRDITGEVKSARFWTFAGDASNEDHADHVISSLASHGLFVDVLINNAGQNDNHTFDEATAEDFDSAFRANCMSAIHCVQAVLPAMRQRRAGAIVCVSSVLGHWASSGSASYSVSKYAVTGLIDVLRQELIGTGINVLGVFPGFIKTDMTLPFVTPGSPKANYGKTPDQMTAAILHALKRGKTELYYPFYVPWLIRLHRLMPMTADRLARHFHHGR